MVQPSSQTLNEPEFGYGQILQILFRRIHWIAAAVIVSVVMAAHSVSQKDPTYESKMQLLIEPNLRPEIDINTGSRTQYGFRDEDYATQLNLMRSDQFIRLALEKLKAKDPDICYEPEITIDCVNWFQSRLSLSQVVEDETSTRIFTAYFSGGDPEETQNFLIALRDSYLEYNLDQQEKRLTDGLKLVNQQLNEIQRELISSQQNLEEFRQQQNLIDPERQAALVTDALDRVQRQQQDISVQYQDVAARYEELTNTLEINPELALVNSRLTQSGRYQSLLNRLQDTEVALEERLAIYTEADAGVQDLQSQRDRQVGLLRQEVERIFEEVPNGLESDSNSLLNKGQLSELDLSLINDLVKAQIDLRRLEAQLVGLAQSEQDLRTRLNEFPSLIAMYDRLQPEVETKRESLEKLLEIRQELTNELAQGGFNWEVLEEPLEGQKTGPNAKADILLGLVAGAFLGGILAFGRDMLDGTVRRAEEIAAYTHTSLLGTTPDVVEIPKIKWSNFSLFTKLSSQSINVVTAEPLRDAVDLIYRKIRLLERSKTIDSLLVTSATSGEGKTTLALGLALSAARAHQRVLLVDANLRQPSLHHQFALSDTEGLTTLLTSEKAVYHPMTLSFHNVELDVLPAGPQHSDPLHLLSSNRMKTLIAELEKLYDLVVFDSPALIGLADSLQIASLCSSVVFVGRINGASKTDLSQAKESLEQIDILGTIINGVKPVRSKYHSSNKNMFKWVVDSSEKRAQVHRETSYLTNSDKASNQDRNEAFDYTNRY